MKTNLNPHLRVCITSFLPLFICAITTLTGCATPTKGPSSAPLLSVSDMAAIATDFDANLVDNVRTKLARVSKNPAERSDADSGFLETLLKKNTNRGFECSADLNTLLVTEYRATVKFDRLETLDLARLTTCENIAYVSMVAETTENQIYFQRAFLEQLVTEMNSVVKYNESQRSPSGLKLQLLVELNRKTDQFFITRCGVNPSKIESKEHCEARELNRSLYKKLKTVLNEGLKTNPALRKTWMPPVMLKFFKDIAV